MIAAAQKQWCKKFNMGRDQTSYLLQRCCGPCFRDCDVEDGILESYGASNKVGEHVCC